MGLIPSERRHHLVGVEGKCRPGITKQADCPGANMGVGMIHARLGDGVGEFSDSIECPERFQGQLPRGRNEAGDQFRLHRFVPAVRQQAYKEALARISGELYWLPMFTYAKYYVFSNELDFKTTPDEIPRFYTAKWK